MLPATVAALSDQNMKDAMQSGSSLLAMVRSEGINQLNPNLARDIIDQFALDQKQLKQIAKCFSI